VAGVAARRIRRPEAELAEIVRSPALEPFAGQHDAGVGAARREARDAGRRLALARESRHGGHAPETVVIGHDQVLAEVAVRGGYELDDDDALTPRGERRRAGAARARIVSTLESERRGHGARKARGRDPARVLDGDRQVAVEVD